MRLRTRASPMAGKSPDPWAGLEWGSCSAGEEGGGSRLALCHQSSTGSHPLVLSVFQLCHQTYKPFVFAAETLADLSM